MNALNDRQKTWNEFYPKPASFLPSIAPVPLNNATLNDGGIITTIPQIPEDLPDLSKPVLLTPTSFQVFSKFVYKNRIQIAGFCILTGVVVYIAIRMKKQNDEENANKR
jgi:hypothetical protein